MVIEIWLVVSIHMHIQQNFLCMRKQDFGKTSQSVQHLIILFNCLILMVFTREKLEMYINAYLVSYLYSSYKYVYTSKLGLENVQG